MIKHTGLPSWEGFLFFTAVASLRLIRHPIGCTDIGMLDWVFLQMPKVATINETVNSQIW